MDRKLRPVLLIAILLCLGSCSYSYDVRVEIIDGQLVFTSEKSWFRERCVREIEVIADDRKDAAAAEAGDDEEQVGYGSYWSVDMDYHCENRFPIVYGAKFVGEPKPGEETGIEVSAKPLKKNVVYDVLTVSGATGYGGGRFMLHSDGTVENLGRY